jgi:hypothetical protein
VKEDDAFAGEGGDERGLGPLLRLGHVGLEARDHRDRDAARFRDLNLRPAEQGARGPALRRCNAISHDFILDIMPILLASKPCAA